MKVKAHIACICNRKLKLSSAVGVRKKPVHKEKNPKFLTSHGNFINLFENIKAFL